MKARVQPLLVSNIHATVLGPHHVKRGSLEWQLQRIADVVRDAVVEPEPRVRISAACT